jgi:hypothetical protein
MLPVLFLERLISDKSVLLLLLLPLRLGTAVFTPGLGLWFRLDVSDALVCTPLLVLLFRLDAVLLFALLSRLDDSLLLRLESSLRPLSGDLGEVTRPGGNGISKPFNLASSPDFLASTSFHEIKCTSVNSSICEHRCGG